MAIISSSVDVEMRAKRAIGLDRLRGGLSLMTVRCLKGAAIMAAAFWLAAVLYLVLTPRTYISRFTLIVPGAGASTTVQLESIGQSTSNVNSPYNSVSLNPKVVYKELAHSDLVRSAAAERLGVDFAELGRPRVKLIDETSLMMFEMTSSTADSAQQKSQALLAAFNEQLDYLRKDELSKRAEAVTKNLNGYKAAVDVARQRITEIQVESGLVSIIQFNEIVTSLAASRRKLSDLHGDLDRLRQEQARLGSRLGFGPGEASIALRVASDPSLVKIVSEYSEASGLFASESRRLGPENPTLKALANRRDAALGKIRVAINATTASDADKWTHVLVANVSQQAELLQQLVRTEAMISGKTEEVKTIAAEKERLDAEVARLSTSAARLEDLRKEQILAEAVYSSALARVDTSKSDIYGAYPIVQVVAPPTRPDGHEQPRRFYAIAGGMAGTAFSAVAWGLVWLHYYQSRKRRKKKSSSG
ncbi:MAG: hypothetical protein K2Y05_04160 [Hyphomicrobiaceae bacterium]|nr:hypothetical protein [Hyphomicrobiaceae bacterium]